MTKSIEEYKRDILFKRSLKDDPYSSLQDLFGGSASQRIETVFIKKAIENALPDIIKDVTDEMTKKVVESEGFAQGIIYSILENIRQPEDGKNGEKGKDGKNGENGKITQGEINEVIKKVSSKVKSGKDGKTPQKYVDYFTQEEIEEMANKAVSVFKGEDIVNKINELPLTPDKQIDWTHIKGMPKADKQLGVSLHRGGLKLIWDTQLSGTVDGVNTVFTVPSNLPGPKDNKYIVSARGTLKTVDGGDFTISSDNRTITFTSSPPNGSDAPRIILYHAK